MSHTETPIFAQGSIPEFEHDGDDKDRYYLPARAMSLGMRYPNGLVMLPDAPEVQVYASQMRRLLSELDHTTPATVFVPDSDYFLDKAIGQNLSLLSPLLSYDQNYAVWPYANTTFLESWIRELSDQGYNIASALPPKIYFEDQNHIQHRGGWGRWVGQPKTQSIPEIYGIPYPVSHIGTGLEEIKDAYRLTVAKTGKPGAFFKPIFSAGGFTLRQITSEVELETHYLSLRTSQSLDLFGREIPVEIQESLDIHGLESLQYTSGQVVTPGLKSVQMVEGSQWVGNIFNTASNPEDRAEVEEIFSRFSTAARSHSGQLSGMGGLDLAVVERQGRLQRVVLEHNGGRITGAHPAILLSQTLGVTDRPFLIRKTPNPSCDLTTLWAALKTEGLAFDPITKQGVFPLLWIDGSGFLFTVGEDEQTIRSMTDAVLELTAKNGFHD